LTICPLQTRFEFAISFFQIPYTDTQGRYHVSIQTTERYLGCKQRFRDAVNDHMGLEPDAPS